MIALYLRLWDFWGQGLDLFPLSLSLTCLACSMLGMQKACRDFGGCPAIILKFPSPSTFQLCQTSSFTPCLLSTLPLRSPLSLPKLSLSDDDLLHSPRKYKQKRTSTNSPYIYLPPSISALKFHLHYFIRNKLTLLQLKAILLFVC